MRTWRKLYSKILDSTAVATLSDGAIVLLAFLIAAQDDSGYYPDDDTSIRRLSVTRPLWSRDVYVALRDELETAGILRLEEGGVLLVKGADLNGLPRKDVEIELYPRDRHVNTTSTSREQGDTATVAPDTSTSREQDVALEQRRAEQNRAEESRAETRAPARLLQPLPGIAEEISWAEGFHRIEGLSQQTLADLVSVGRKSAAPPDEGCVLAFCDWWRLNHGRYKSIVSTWRNWLKNEHKVLPFSDKPGLDPNRPWDKGAEGPPLQAGKMRATPDNW